MAGEKDLVNVKGERRKDLVLVLCRLAKNASGPVWSSSSGEEAACVPRDTIAEWYISMALPALTRTPDPRQPNSEKEEKALLLLHPSFYSSTFAAKPGREITAHAHSNLSAVASCIVHSIVTRLFLL